eukprot:TRINITY_DN627_c0_g1_i1.p1 TRINITY_DN627_c0_g1~~TRINITY_DN627_c0_g1_i1.p1  ORF type:complete len:333 (+),score=70.08 TRINITY_DN627_c0_g1_i1:27-1025(+)
MVRAGRGAGFDDPIDRRNEPNSEPISFGNERNGFDFSIPKVVDNEWFRGSYWKVLLGIWLVLIVLSIVGGLSGQFDKCFERNGVLYAIAYGFGPLILYIVWFTCSIVASVATAPENTLSMLSCCTFQISIDFSFAILLLFALRMVTSGLTTLLKDSTCSLTFYNSVPLSIAVGIYVFLSSDYIVMRAREESHDMKARFTVPNEKKAWIIERFLTAFGLITVFVMTIGSVFSGYVSIKQMLYGVHAGIIFFFFLSYILAMCKYGDFPPVNMWLILGPVLTLSIIVCLIYSPSSFSFFDLLFIILIVLSLVVTQTRIQQMRAMSNNGGNSAYYP